MSKEKIKILAIESSCDETAAAVIEEQDGQPVVLSNIISSQVDLHAKTGGVVPEVASRAHMEAIIPVVVLALLKTKQGISNFQFPISNQFSNDQIHNQQINENWVTKNEQYQEAILLLDEITHIAVTAGPGLIGSLMVGFNAAKTLAYGRNLPIIPINHIEGHIYSAFGGVNFNNQYPITNQSPIANIQVPRAAKMQFPLLALTVSGGHTSLTLMHDHGKYECIGGTIDDAVGEAYDKVAKLLGLGYPGGPIISKLASEFRNSQQSTVNSRLLTVIFPRPIINDGTYKLSFSGLKTAVLQFVLDEKKKQFFSCHPELVSGSTKNKQIPDQVRNDISKVELSIETKQEISAAFEEAVADVLCAKTKKAIEQYSPKALIFAGGVSANGYLKSRLQSAVDSCQSSIDFLTPPRELSGDNAAMIGIAAYYHILKGDVSSWNDIKVDSNWDLV